MPCSIVLHTRASLQAETVRWNGSAYQVTVTSLVVLRLPPVRTQENFVLGCESVRYCAHVFPLCCSTARKVPSRCRLFCMKTFRVASELGSCCDVLSDSRPGMSQLRFDRQSMVSQEAEPKNPQSSCQSAYCPLLHQSAKRSSS